MGISEVVSRWRTKFPNVAPQVKEVYDPSSGELLQTINADGSETLDPTPIAPPIGYKRQPSLAEQIREMVRSERLAAEMAAQGMETFEESEDFDVDDDIDPRSQWENEFDPDIREVKQAVEEDRKTRVKAASPEPKKPASGDQPDPVIDPAKPGDQQS